MARMVLGVAGAVVGSFFGQPQLGFMIGSMIGGVVDPEVIKNEGPRMSDLKVQVSSWGVPIRIYKGAMRGAGNVIWSTPIRETKTVTEESGKGGPTMESTTYTYSADIAVALGEGEIVGIRKIFADGRLIYSASADADAETISQSQAISTSFTVYPGSQDQMPDPTIEADKGAGNVSAYRGLAYVVFENFQLANYGNRIPNFEFEVIESGSDLRERVLSSNAPMPIVYDAPLTSGVGVPVIRAIDGGVVRVTTLLGDITYLYSLSGDYLGHEPRRAADDYPSTGPIGMLGGKQISYDWAQMSTPISGGAVLIKDTGFSLRGWVPSGISADEYLGGAALSADGTRMMIMTAPARVDVGGEEIIDKWYLIDVAGDVIDQGAISPPQSITEFGFGNATSVNNTSCALENDLSTLWTARAGSDGSVIIFTIGADMVLAPSAQIDNAITTFFSYPSIYAEKGIAVVVADNRFTILTRMPSLESTAVACAEIVADLCMRSGLAAEDIDVAELTDEVHGYAITRMSTARQNLDQLQKAYYFDAVESDRAIASKP